MVCEKKVVEDVPGWLRVFDDGSVDRSWTGPSEAEFLATPVPPSEQFIDGVATRDTVIDPKSGLSVRIYLPEEEPEDPAKLPILLHFHGGGFCISRASWYMYHQFYTRLIKSARAICVSVEMRMAPEHRLPAAVDDCYAALEWLQALARGDSTEPWLGAHGDFGRVFLIGDSSGGNLVHAVAARAGFQEWASLRLAGGVPIHPGFVRAERSQSELRTELETPFLTLKMVDTFLSLALPIGSTKDHPFTCPMGSSAPPLEKLHLPPFLVVVADRDLLKDTEMEYVKDMKEAGKEIEVAYNKGVGHSFYLNKMAVDLDPVTATETDSLISTISDFVRRH